LSQERRKSIVIWPSWNLSKFGDARRGTWVHFYCDIGGQHALHGPDPCILGLSLMLNNRRPCAMDTMARDLPRINSGTMGRNSRQGISNISHRPSLTFALIFTLRALDIANHSISMTMVRCLCIDRLGSFSSTPCAGINPNLVSFPLMQNRLHFEGP